MQGSMQLLELASLAAPACCFCLELLEGARPAAFLLLEVPLGRQLPLALRRDTRGAMRPYISTHRPSARGPSCPQAGHARRHAALHFHLQGLLLSCCWPVAGLLGQLPGGPARPPALGLSHRPSARRAGRCRRMRLRCCQAPHWSALHLRRTGYRCYRTGRPPHCPYNNWSCAAATLYAPHGSHPPRVPQQDVMTICWSRNDHLLVTAPVPCWSRDPG